MAVRVVLDTDALRVGLTGTSAVWALRRNLVVPLRQVRSARVDDRIAALRKLRGLRMPGTHLPGVITAGTYRSIRPGGGRQFWSVRRAERVLVVDLGGGRYTRIVLELPDAEGTAGAINAAAGS